MLQKRLLQATVTASCLTFGATAMAATSASWLTPPDGSSFLAGTTQTVTGVAGASGGSAGIGLDLALVLDSSGSMGIYESGKTRKQWQAEAAKALVDALPVGSTAVSIVEFDSSASTVKVLTELTADTSALHAAINSVDASGGTFIGSGITQAKNELTGANHTAGRQQMMVVLSDGSTSGNPGETADGAIGAGVDAIHSVGLPGHVVSTMKGIVDGADDSYGTGDDHGIYTGVTDLTTLESIFNGTGGNLVGLDYIDVTLPDGTVLADWATDGLGNFSVDYALALGANLFRVDAYGTDGTQAFAEWTLYGTQSQVPEPTTMLLFGTGLAGLAGYSRRRTKK